MSDIEYKSNIEGFAKALDETDKNILKKAKRGVLLGVREFEGYMLKRYFSGRPGLNRRSGTAAGSWSVRSTDEVKDFVVRLTNANRAFYIVMHQRGGWIHAKNKPYLKFKVNGRWVSKKSVFIPKRLYIPEDFKKLGPRMLKNRVMQAVIYGR